MLRKITSDGQTGVDRGTLDADFPCGGRCPEARRAEDGTIPARYPLTPLPGADYEERTRKNLMDADGTAILYFGELEGGTETTAHLCKKNRRAYTLIDGDELAVERAVALLADFIDTHGNALLNVAGPRTSTKPNAHGYAYAVVEGLLRRLRR